METIQGLITNKEIKNGVSNKTNKPYTMCTYIINDKNYRTFDEKIYEKFNQGDNVKSVLEAKGNFLNMLSMELVELSPYETQKFPLNLSNPKMIVKEEKSNGFHLAVEHSRAESLNAALKYSEVFGVEDMNIKNLVNIANDFFEYITQDS